ncbi:T9SS type A sorting domain-containing protein [bacterium]|nr:T9SS type A sorting domain-containing protein [bacterium]
MMRPTHSRQYPNFLFIIILLILITAESSHAVFFSRDIRTVPEEPLPGIPTITQFELSTWDQWGYDLDSLETHLGDQTLELSFYYSTWPYFFYLFAEVNVIHEWEALRAGEYSLVCNVFIDGELDFSWSDDFRVTHEGEPPLQIVLPANRYYLYSFPFQPEQPSPSELVASLLSRPSTVMYEDLRHQHDIIEGYGELDLIGFGNYFMGRAENDFDPFMAARIFVETQDTLLFYGDPIDPEQEYQFYLDRWSILGHPYWEDVPVDVALDEVADHLQILLSDDGKFWIPNLVNSLNVLEPTKAYYAYFDETVTFQYPQEFLTTPPDYPLEIVQNEVPELGFPLVILVEAPETESNETLSVRIDTDQGKSFIKGLDLENASVTPVVVWLESPLDDGNLPGNSILEVTIQNSEHGTVFQELVEYNGEPYLWLNPELNSVVEETSLPEEFEIISIFPNPFNSLTTVAVKLPEQGVVHYSLTDLLGKRVLENSFTRRVGLQEIVINGESLASGLYFLRVDFQGSSRMRKLVLMK